MTGFGVDEFLVFALDAAEELEDDDEADDADAGAGEHAVGGDVPAAGDEAWPGGFIISIPSRWGGREGREHRGRRTGKDEERV